MFRRVCSAVLACALMLLGLPVGASPALALDSPANGAIDLVAFGVPYLQNFDTLASTLSSDVLPAGWALSESGTSSANDGRYAAGTGSATAGDTYSFGASANSERAFGTLLSGTLTPLIGASFRNSTGVAINQVDIAYTGEQWRVGAVGRGQDRLDFQYSLTATSLTTGTWTNVDALDFASPSLAAVGPLNGNAAANRQTLSATLALLLMPGATLWIRWSDFNVASSDDGLAVDEFSLTVRNADAAPAITATTPIAGAAGVARNANLTVTFSEPVTMVSAAWFSISCTTTGSHAGEPAGSGTTFTIDPTADFAAGETCTVTILASQVKDQDASDPPDNMAADFAWSFTVITPDECGDPATRIHDIQGSGLTSPLVGQQRTIEGVVIGHYRDPLGSGSGFYVQEEGADVDADETTSEGIFVVSSATVAVGAVVRATGRVTEFTSSNSSLTEIASITSVKACPYGATVTPTTVTLPVPSLTYFERYEGMLVTFTQVLTVTETFGLGRFGEVRLSANGRLYTPTALTTPGAAAIALEAQNQLRSFVLDDGSNLQNSDPVLYPNGGLSAGNTLRSGYTVDGLTGVFDQRFGSYRMQRVETATFEATNLRSAAPAAVGGNTKVASFNVLNFFNGDGQGGGFPTSRGANTSFEFERQKAKEISALTAMNADIVGLMEIENDSGTNSALAELVAALNAAMGAGTYSFIDTGAIGTDAIKVALIYKPAAVTPIGAFRLMTSAVDPRFIDTLNRPSLAQTFERNGAGARLTVVVNHLKSKGSACTGDTDIGDGQGNCNATRTQAAAALADWLATDPTGSGDSRVLLIGDMNAYTFEAPIMTFESKGYTNLVRRYNGLGAYSYVFNGAAGYLDHALASPSLAAQATGAVDWHINADEPVVLDYNVEFKTANQINTFYAPDAYRSSDHDPVVIGLDLRDTTNPTITGTATTDPNPLGWYKTDVTVRFVCADNLAVASCGPDATLTSDGAGQSVTGTATDAAGNTATVTVSGINIDKTAPTITFGGNAGSYTVSQTIAITCTAADGLSGLASQTCANVSAAAYTFSVGSHTLTATATDRAGNITTVTTTFTVTADTTTLCTLTRTFVTNAGAANSLCQKLDAAAAAAARGQTATARNILDAYAHEVDAQRGKKVTDAQADILIAIASTL